jgi:hypothetical protein
VDGMSVVYVEHAQRVASPRFAQPTRLELIRLRRPT